MSTTKTSAWLHKASATLAHRPWRTQVTDEQLTAWLQKVQKVKSEFLIEEIMHYATLAHVQRGVVPAEAEYEYLVSQYQPASATTQPLQSPEHTFGEKIANRPCPKCHSRDTLSFVVQARSADEPASVFFQCVTCRHSWKIR